MFSKQHYEAIAEELKETRPRPEDYSDNEAREFGAVMGMWTAVKYRLTTMFKWDNIRFDEDAFHKACFAN